MSCSWISPHDRASACGPFIRDTQPPNLPTAPRFLDSCQSGLLRHLVVLEEKVDSVAARCAGDRLRNAKANALLHHAYSWLKTSYYFQDRAAVASLRWPAGFGDDRSRQPK